MKFIYIQSLYYLHSPTVPLELDTEPRVEVLESEREIRTTGFYTTGNAMASTK